MIPVWANTILQIVLKMFGVVEKAIPPDEIRIDNHNERKELREQDFSQAMITDDFAYLKRRTEIDIDTYLEYVHPTLENLKGYSEIVKARVHEYRYDRPVLYRNWIKSNPR